MFLKAFLDPFDQQYINPFTYRYLFLVNVVIIKFYMISIRTTSFWLMVSSLSTFLYLSRGHSNFGKRGHFYFGVAHVQLGLDMMMAICYSFINL
jgi:hypothetical protein